MTADADLQRDVTNELQWDAAIDARFLSVAAHAGIVTITGHIPHYLQHDEIEQLAESIAGVKEVVLRVSVEPTEVPSDADLVRFAADAVAACFEPGANPIEIKVDDAWITLKGSVAWDFQRRSIMTSLGALRGLRGITNDITIRTPAVPAREIKTTIEAALHRLFDADRQRIDVNVVNGEVTLTGSVTSGWQRQMVTRSAWNAVGVHSVRDDLLLDV